MHLYIVASLREYPHLEINNVLLILLVDTFQHMNEGGNYTFIQILVIT